MKPLETGNFEGGGPTGFTLPKNEIKFLFSNVLEIYSFHKVDFCFFCLFFWC